MRTVNIAQLKNQLSTYIRYAKSGEQIIIRDRNLPVAALVPISSDNATDEDLALVAAGIMKMPALPWDPDAFDKLPLARVAGNAGTQAIVDERDESR